MLRDDLSIDLTISDIPAGLIREFTQRIVRANYPGGISPAIKDLMWIAVQKSKEKQTPLSL